MRTDDLLRAAPQLAPWRPKIGIAPRLSDAELVTPAVEQLLLGFTSDVPAPPERLEQTAEEIGRPDPQVMRELATDTAP
ncbi:hypothetical protein [Streptomyces sporangiiformans]|uniref:hypothetical protein n=1 Tax=Streptomyces sporangiiformans TaxID=2315329 RepID=UPI001F0990A1|nr:hypothetical protein [Streptomyces sporangiiformans]